jgi:hypothetical protein
VEAFAAEQLEQTSVAEMFLHRYADEEAALQRLAALHQEASPVVPETTKPTAPEMCIITTPHGPAGEQLRQWAGTAVTGAEVVAGDDDALFIYREQSFLPLGESEHLGVAPREAYQQMCSTEHFTPHARTDVNFSR